MATHRINSFLQHLIEAPMTTGAGNGSQRTSQRSGDYNKSTGNYLNPKDRAGGAGVVPEPAIIKPGGPLDGSAYQSGAGPGDDSIPPTFSARPVPGYKPGDYVRNPDFQGQPDDIYNEFWGIFTPPKIPDFTLSDDWYYKKPKDEKPPVKPPEEEPDTTRPSIPAGPFRDRGGRPRR